MQKKVHRIKKKNWKRICKITNSKEVMIDEDGGKKDLEINHLREQNEFVNECQNELEIAHDETIQRLTDADGPAIKPSENKTLTKTKNQYKTDLALCKKKLKT